MKTEYAHLDDKKINNDYYHELGEQWYSSRDDPIALLRAEAKLKAPWIVEKIRRLAPNTKSVLDVGCGAGFISNHLARAKYEVSAIDLSENSLAVAKQKDETGTVNYIYADAYQLPFSNASFDCIVSTDFLEHVSEPQKVLKEIYRVLKPGGIFFFHTFSKNPISYILSIKFIDWFMKNPTKDIHVYSLFIKPKVLLKWLNDLGFENSFVKGIRPKVNKDFFKLLTTGVMPESFSFVWSKFILMTYIGYTFKNNESD